MTWEAASYPPDLGKIWAFRGEHTPETAVQIDGKDLYLGVNAYVYAPPKGTL
jgi:hypothetical protein